MNQSRFCISWSPINRNSGNKLIKEEDGNYFFIDDWVYFLTYNSKTSQIEEESKLRPKLKCEDFICMNFDIPDNDGCHGTSFNECYLLAAEESIRRNKNVLFVYLNSKKVIKKESARSILRDSLREESKDIAREESKVRRRRRRVESLKKLLK